ncbi:MAG TPA: hypothetical protein VFB36_02725 [Nevskiaceae bacterium]|nr:hypothetical protein [Nevskiaceae bacterium]
MSLTIAEHTELLGRIASDRQFRSLLLTSPRKAACELGITLSESEEGQILSGLRAIHRDGTDRLPSDAQTAPFLFSVLLTHDDAGDEDEDPPKGSERRRPH